jgi:hypothetical protein
MEGAVGAQFHERRGDGGQIPNGWGFEHRLSRPLSARRAGYVIEIVAERGKRGEKVTMEQVKELVEERKPGPKPTPKDAAQAEYDRLVEEGRKVAMKADAVRSAPVRIPPSAEPPDDDEVEPEMDPMRQHTPRQDRADPDPAKTVPDPDGRDVESDDYDPLDPYDFGMYSENIWQAVLRAGLITNDRESKFFIHDRAVAVAWSEQMLADYDKTHPGKGK